MSAPTDATNDTIGTQSNKGLSHDEKKLDKGNSVPFSGIFWRDHEPWLKTAGYILRSRYHPSWVASWFTDPKKIKFGAEDYIKAREISLIDATRERDGLQVMLKKIRLQYHPAEIEIANLFSSEPLASDPRNHCIPIYEVLTLPGDNDTAILVMPFLLPMDRPPFVSLGEIVEFLQQIIEGLHFMHQQNVAHCDVKVDNVMSDTRRLFRVPPHPVVSSLRHSGKGEPKLSLNRMQNSVKHYLIDFGLSNFHPPGSSRLQSPGYGGTRTVPEFQDNSTQLCDPFAVDVYCMGDFIRTRFREGENRSAAFNGLEFMDDLIADMVQHDPKKRPTMDEVVERFSAVVDSLSKWKLMSRASTVDETTSERIVKNVRYWIGIY
ncbi:kinase-like domain-containing protein [Cyathus striatus]|nr:kinase-like domain-containing protein [Cyathus striatus]